MFSSRHKQRHNDRANVGRNTRQLTKNNRRCFVLTFSDLLDRRVYFNGGCRGTIMNKEHLILPIARDTKAIVIFTGEITQEAISKLIELLECEKETYPTKGEIVADEKAV